MAKKKEASELTPEALQKAINKRWGEGSMMMASDPSLQIKRIPTGILSVDIALGGGIARGRHTEMYGGYSVGKTYVAYRTIASAQKKKIKCAFIDVEGSFDPTFAEHAGVKLDKLAFHQQEHGNRVIDFIETLLRSQQYGVICLDSIAALLPKQEREMDMEAGSYGTQQAKMMSAALRRLTAANRSTALIYINQTRDAIGSMFAKSVTSGGRAMSFYAGTRLELVRTENIKKSVKQIDPKTQEEKNTKVVVAHRVLVKVEKDKTGGARQHSTTSFVFHYAKAQIDPIEDLMYVGRVYGFVHKKGNFYWVDEYEDEKQNGRAKFKKWLRKNAAVAEDLEEWIWEAFEEERELIFNSEDTDEEESSDDGSDD